MKPVKRQSTFHLRKLKLHTNGQLSKTFIFYSIPLDWFVSEMLNNPEFGRSVVRKFIDLNQVTSSSTHPIFQYWSGRAFDTKYLLLFSKTLYQNKHGIIIITYWYFPFVNKRLSLPQMPRLFGVELKFSCYQKNVCVAEIN